MTLLTERMLLRPFELSDADEVQRLAGDPKVSRTTVSTPYPYEDGMAEQWISQHEQWRLENSNHVFAMTSNEGGDLLGAISLGIFEKHQKGTLGYWVGLDYWNKGYCTEAVSELIRWGFEDLDLHRIEAHHMGINPTSGRVMEKCGMLKEGVHRKTFLKNGNFEDMVFYGILKTDWKSS